MNNYLCKDKSLHLEIRSSPVKLSIYEKNNLFSFIRSLISFMFNSFTNWSQTIIISIRFRGINIQLSELQAVH